jgi:hypothetical protein
MTFVNQIIKNWDICVDVKKISIRDSTSKKVVCICKYKLNYYQNINNYI